MKLEKTLLLKAAPTKKTVPRCDPSCEHESPKVTQTVWNPRSAEEMELILATHSYEPPLASDCYTFVPCLANSHNQVNNIEQIGQEVWNSVAVSEGGKTIAIGAPGNIEVKVYRWNEAALSHKQLGQSIYGKSSTESKWYDSSHWSPEKWQQWSEFRACQSVSTVIYLTLLYLYPVGSKSWMLVVQAGKCLVKPSKPSLVNP